jgi:prepilin-type N-terminal cleavage/methylation domain-containing protein
MRGQKAFTFSELLVAVAALALLAAAAVPRFLAINSETRMNSVEALAVNVRSSAQLTNRIWLSNDRLSRLTVGGQELEMRFGYPTENSIDDIVVNSGEFVFQEGFFNHRDLLTTPGCAVLYIPPPGPEFEPLVITYTDGC